MISGFAYWYLLHHRGVLLVSLVSRYDLGHLLKFLEKHALIRLFIVGGSFFIVLWYHIPMRGGLDAVVTDQLCWKRGFYGGREYLRFIRRRSSVSLNLVSVRLLNMRDVAYVRRYGWVNEEPLILMLFLQFALLRLFLFDPLLRLLFCILKLGLDQEVPRHLLLYIALLFLWDVYHQALVYLVLLRKAKCCEHTLFYMFLTCSSPCTSLSRVPLDFVRFLHRGIIGCSAVSLLWGVRLLSLMAACCTYHNSPNYGLLFYLTMLRGFRYITWLVDC